MFISTVQFQIFVESMPCHTEAVIKGPTFYYVAFHLICLYVEMVLYTLHYSTTDELWSLTVIVDIVNVQFLKEGESNVV